MRLTYNMVGVNHEFVLIIIDGGRYQLTMLIF
ncbi:hypothetical protein Dd1591_1329 [Dickeya chrysanthemi Ech1591]|uniref:Uncharacterized protein n=1 Tax=Dickeya chrysanthemi (strain Ech1591) TaxID=561229 RepID=C6CE82_DICC1|nr:hypothetical protein Dd1591_1329 [Dickeya chrysanthemi Ech1591]